MCNREHGDRLQGGVDRVKYAVVAVSEAETFTPLEFAITWRKWITLQPQQTGDDLALDGRQQLVEFPPSRGFEEYLQESNHSLRLTEDFGQGDISRFLNALVKQCGVLHLFQ